MAQIGSVARRKGVGDSEVGLVTLPLADQLPLGLLPVLRALAPGECPSITEGVPPELLLDAVGRYLPTASEGRPLVEL